MSFVLEALKKQEADRDPEAAVSLAKAGVLHRRHRRWMVLFAVAMLLNAALVGWLLWRGEPSTQRDVAAPATEQPARTERPAAREPAPMWGERQVAAAPSERTPPAPTAAAEPAPTERAAATPAPPPQQAAAAPPQPAPAPAHTASAPPLPAAAPRPATQRVIGLDDLTPAERRRFPGIAFSTHIYSEDPELRAVVANGQRRQEGQRIRGLEILQITQDGVVLEFEDKRVKVPLAVDWDSL